MREYERGLMSPYRLQSYMSSNEGKRLVQTQGYEPMSQRIEALMSAGVRLASARAEQYDADHKTPIDEIYANRIRSLEKLEGLYMTTQLKIHLENKRKNYERAQAEYNMRHAPSTDGTAQNTGTLVPEVDKQATVGATATP